MMDRKRLLLTEFSWYADDNVPLIEFMYLSDVAFSRRERRIKAAKENKVIVD